MFAVNKTQLNAMVLASPRLLVWDIENHLREFRPAVLAACPRPCLRWMIEDSLTIGRGFGIDDVQLLRVFVRLRWDIAPAYFEQPQIAAVLRDASLSAQQRFERLATEPYAQAWAEARQHGDAARWRQRFWSETA